MLTMCAVGFRQYGTADRLEVLEVPVPTIQPEEILIRVVTAGVNPADSLFRSGALRWFVRLKFPFIPGLDIAGIVTETGSSVTRFRPGDAVYAMLPNTRMGGYAEYAVVHHAAAARLPANLTFSEAAAVPCAALSALQGLRDQAQVTPGTRVLIYGASGGVGTFGVQIAKALDAQVTAACSQRNMAFVRSLGADEILDYAQTNFATAPMHYDAVFDAAGIYSFARWKPVLNPCGTLVTVNLLDGSPLQRLLARFDRERRQLKSLLVQPSGIDLITLNTWFADGVVRPVIDRCYPLQEAAEAQRYSETVRRQKK